ncbi:30S ribosomal protein S8 [bacterium]|nr:30S ribosomal protein S8 [bacterium]
MDPITDMLNRIRNAQAVKHQTVEIPYSNLKQKIGEILVKEGFLEKIEKRRKKGKKLIKISLKYNTNKEPAITGLKRVSKPSQRIYKKAKEIRRVRGGYGLAIISTPQGGLMTDKEARKKKIGGEVICEIW